jgi:LacI family transcriptional regulator
MADVESRKHGEAAMDQLLKLKTRPDSVFCFNDALAVGVLNSILDSGLRIPEDIAVIGCGNLHYVDSLRVPLSSIDQNSTEIGEYSAKLILSILGEKKPRPRRIILKPRLVARASSVR